jgi:quercetin dioxygenase-like cupin family protein
MRIIRAAELPVRQGSPDYFTGEVWQEILSDGGPDGVWVARVSFPPRARTAWHTHPQGQVLVVTSGRGYVQRSGGPRESIAAGDIVEFAPGEKHWHGAAENSPMQHIALQNAVSGVTADWLEKVSDDDYSR